VEVEGQGNQEDKTSNDQRFNDKTFHKVNTRREILTPKLQNNYKNTQSIDNAYIISSKVMLPKRLAFSLQAKSSPHHVFFIFLFPNKSHLTMHYVPKNLG